MGKSGRGQIYPDRVEKMLAVVKRNRTSKSQLSRQKQVMRELRYAIGELLEVGDCHKDCGVVGEIKDPYEELSDF